MASYKSKLFGLVLLSSMLQLTSGFSEEPVVDDGKVYVKRQAVRFFDNEIVVFTKDGAFVTKSLQSDEKGVYVKSDELQKAKVFDYKGQRTKKGSCCNKNRRVNGKFHSMKNKQWKQDHWKNKNWKSKKWNHRTDRPIADVTPAPVQPVINDQLSVN